MRTKIFTGIKIFALAFVLSMGITFVHAWVGPSSNAPASNAATPINTSNKAQIKSGDLTVQNFIANGVATVSSLASGGTVTASDVYLTSSGRYLSNTLPSSPSYVVTGTNTYGAPGSPFLWATVSCPAGTSLTGCSGFYNYGCSGSWFCEYQGAQPWGNGCAAGAFVNQNTVITAYAYCR